jgi:predicted DNA-binding protein with PD1-like motif
MNITSAQGMNLFPLRVAPGADLRKAIEECLAMQGQDAGFVLSGIGSLTEGMVRYAGQHEEALIGGPLEVLSLAGSVSPEGAHLHVSLSTDAGQVFGGHLCYGNTIRTTAEVLLAFLPEWRLSRADDPDTGYRELVVAPQNGEEARAMRQKLHGSAHSTSRSTSRSGEVDAFAARALGATALGALAAGALAVGALAVGALAVGRLAIGRARIRRLEIDELVVRDTSDGRGPFPSTIPAQKS